MTKDEYKRSLENLMLDVEELNKLSKWNNKINFFEITGMTNKEIKHSNFLAWLFDANANHQLGDKVIKRFIQKVILANHENKKINSDLLTISLMEYDKFIIKREWKNLDIFLLNDEDKFTITIENKIYSNERQNQTLDYRERVNEYYPNYTNIFIYLTREGFEAEDNEYWCNADYYMIVESIEETIKENQYMGEDLKIFLNNYIDMLRRDILVDKELEALCEKIYKKHKNALDLIFKYMPNNVSIISEHIKDFIEQNAEKYNLIFDRNDCSNTYIRFTTSYINQLLPTTNDFSYGWKNGKSFMYEISLSNNNKTDCIGVISNTQNSKCIDIYKIAQKDNKKFGIAKKSETEPNIWARVYRSKTILEKEQIQEGLSEIEETLNKNLVNLFEVEIPKFEKLLKENIMLLK